MTSMELLSTAKSSSNNDKVHKRWYIRMAAKGCVFIRNKGLVWLLEHIFVSVLLCPHCQKLTIHFPMPVLFFFIHMHTLTSKLSSLPCGPSRQRTMWYNSFKRSFQSNSVCWQLIPHEFRCMKTSHRSNMCTHGWCIESAVKRDSKFENLWSLAQSWFLGLLPPIINRKKKGEIPRLRRGERLMRTWGKGHTIKYWRFKLSMKKSNY